MLVQFSHLLRFVDNLWWVVFARKRYTIRAIVLESYQSHLKCVLLKKS